MENQRKPTQPQPDPLDSMTIDEVKMIIGDFVVQQRIYEKKMAALFRENEALKDQVANSMLTKPLGDS